MKLNKSQAEKGGAFAGFLAGASVGAKICASTLWWLGPIAAPAIIVGGTLIGGTIGAFGGYNIGGAVAPDFKERRD